MKSMELVNTAANYIDTLSLDEYVKIKNKGHYLNSKLHDFTLFHVMRDILSAQPYNFRRDAIINNDEKLKILCRRKTQEYEHQILESVKSAKQEEHEAHEKFRLERYQSFPFNRVNSGNDWFNCKVHNVEEIFPEQVHGDWPRWNKLRMKAGYKTQIITLSTGEEFIVNWSKQALGIRALDIIDFTTENNSNYIEKRTILGNSNSSISRPISVNIDVLGKVMLVSFYTVRSAYETLHPEYAYSTICAKTKDNKSQEDIDSAFKGYAKGALNICGIYRHSL